LCPRREDEEDEVDEEGGGEQEEVASSADGNSSIFCLLLSGLRIDTGANLQRKHNFTLHFLHMQYSYTNRSILCTPVVLAAHTGEITEITGWNVSKRSARGGQEDVARRTGHRESKIY
jgi:hypothetical protein